MGLFNALHEWVLTLVSHQALAPNPNQATDQEESYEAL